MMLSRTQRRNLSRHIDINPANEQNGVPAYTEAECGKTGTYISDGSTLLTHLIK